jgi:hypothetical protein
MEYERLVNAQRKLKSQISRLEDYKDDSWFNDGFQHVEDGGTGKGVGIPDLDKPIFDSGEIGPPRKLMDPSSR